ncbi:NAD(P) transhydrogenase subunit alpha part 1 [Candidatus Endolissoclinum faulkneri L2]|uniref:proton-translocating NAD(P)(+) transhydrogenase n=1 Tax=Candidatus Endolissoclinum faulkneri L2 TaxID=1193729 RepID=K7YMU9_9PROT|nr:Re/Si-specific NAD(P)(+) transhydrogenase subunit alpha [Candidatus Endolissoclinum faulkneri]AFX98837.1 NAD(P) transhydrogenase subunit alpha part 1 [Candidatus Endolissoclinum faulkneri L2]
MKIGIVKERRDGEKRVAVSTETVRKYINLGANVAIECDAGLSAGITNEAYTIAGANIVNNAREAIGDADIVLKVRKPTFEEITLFKHGALLISLMEPYKDKDIINTLAKQGVRTFALELVPRITRAQSMDVLSSQSNLVGYKSVLDAANLFGRSFPMMTTAAGTIPPARVLVIGAGVAGLQAIATARRLGAIVSAMDVRVDTKEQIESLGATFLGVKSMDYKQSKIDDGYANEMSDEYKNKQFALIGETIVNQDIVITTALIPGKSAPVLITESMVKSMKPGSIIVDIAVEQGGNCRLSKIGAVVKAYGITIVGYNDAPSRIAIDASALYARNLLNFLTLIIDKDSQNININENDEIIKSSSIINNGMITNELVLSINE